MVKVNVPRTVFSLRELDGFVLCTGFYLFL